MRGNSVAIQVNIYQTKTNLSKLINKVIEGDEVIIARSGKPVAKLVPIIYKDTTKRKAGLFKNKIKYSDDIDRPLPEDIIKDFYK
jgi:prevent-host-death family protein